MIPKHVLFIINPISGTRRKRSIPSLIQKHLDHTRFTHEVRFTEHAGHATEIAAQAAADGVDIVVAVGGDGTINQDGTGHHPLRIRQRTGTSSGAAAERPRGHRHHQ